MYLNNYFYKQQIPKRTTATIQKVSQHVSVLKLNLEQIKELDAQCTHFPRRNSIEKMYF